MSAEVKIIPMVKNGFKFIRLALLLILGLMLPCAAAPTPAPKAVGGLKFYLQLKSSELQVHKPVEFTLNLKNSGKLPLWVNHRFLVNYPSHPHEIMLRVMGPTHEIPWNLKIRAGEPQESDFTLLAPGQTLYARLTLTQAFTLDAPGTYKVTAWYENHTSPSGKKAWRGKLSSNTVSFTLEELK